jgi:hypothetical protein
MMISDGYVARWQGHEYEASPDGGLVRLYATVAGPGFEQVGPARYRRLVAATDVEWLGYAHTTAQWRGEPVLVLAERDGGCLVEYVGGRAPVARALGLTRVDVAVYRGWVDRAELSAVRQERIVGG